MDDGQILDLYWERSEDAISETDRKYGRYCYSIANNILSCPEDAEECVSDTYVAAWRAIPPKRPSVLATFLGKITRRLSIDRWRAGNRLKRGGGEVNLALDELSDFVAGHETVDSAMERKQIVVILNRFLESLPEIDRNIFLCRYWYFDPISKIGGYYGFSDSKVTSILFRLRKKLRAMLEKEELL